MVVPPEGYLTAAREITRSVGALLVVDEVQTGVGRTGRWFAFQAENVVPDVVTLAKGLGGGLPLGACVASGEAAHLLEPGQHGTTFGGNPVCCAAGLAVLRTIADEGLLDHVAELGKDIARRIDGLHHPLVAGARGVGLLLGLRLTRPVAPEVADQAAEAGYLVNPVQPDCVRLAPPLVLTHEDAHRFLDALPGVLDAVAHRIPTDPDHTTAKRTP